MRLLKRSPPPGNSSTRKAAATIWSRRRSQLQTSNADYRLIYGTARARPCQAGPLILKYAGPIGRLVARAAPQGQSAAEAARTPSRQAAQAAPAASAPLTPAPACPVRPRRTPPGRGWGGG